MPDFQFHTERLVMLALLTPSQAVAERLVLAANSETLRTCALRSSMVFGPGDLQVIPPIHNCIGAYQTPFVIGSGTNLYDFTYVTNVADAHVLAIENLLGSKLARTRNSAQPSGSAAGEAFFITNGEPVPFRAFCLAVWKEFGHIPKFEVRIPQSLAWYAGIAAEVVSWTTGKELGISRGAVKDACLTRYANLEKARTVLGYRPRVSLEDGIRQACEVRVFEPLMYIVS